VRPSRREKAFAEAWGKVRARVAFRKLKG